MTITPDAAARIKELELELSELKGLSNDQQQSDTPIPEPTTPPDEHPSVTLASVLKHLVNNARVPDEATVHLYHEVIDKAWERILPLLTAPKSDQ